MKRLGRGVIQVFNPETKEFQYNGTWPDCEQGDEVVIMLAEDLERIIRADENALLINPSSMNKQLYEKQLKVDGDFSFYDNPLLVDKLIHTAIDGTKHNLYLDRHTYSSNPRDMIWVRYVSVDEAFYEEGFNPPDGGVHEDGE